MKNYTRSSNYYTKVLSSLEASYPGLKDQKQEYFSKTGIPIQAQNRCLNRTPIDMRG